MNDNVYCLYFELTSETPTSEVSPAPNTRFQAIKGFLTQETYAELLDTQGEEKHG